MEKYTKLASSGDDIKIWDIKTKSLIKSYNPHTHTAPAICWSHDNDKLVSGSPFSDKITLTCLKDVTLSPPELSYPPGVTCLDFNSTSRYLLCGNKECSIAVFDVKNRKIKKVYQGHKAPITSAKFNHDDQYIAAGSENGEIILHNVVTGIGSRALIAPSVQEIHQLQYSHHKKSLLGSVSDDGGVNLWDTNTRQLLHCYKEHRAPAMGLTFSQINDALLLSCGLDKRMVFYDVLSKSAVRSINVESPLTAIDIMYDGATIAAGSTRGEIFLYDLRHALKPVNVFSSHKSCVMVLKFQFEQSSSSAENVPSKPVTVTHRQLPSAPVGQETPSSIPFQNPSHQEVNVSDDVFSPLREGYGDGSPAQNIVTNRDSSLGGSFTKTRIYKRQDRQYAYGNIDGESGISPLRYHSQAAGAISDQHIDGSKTDFDSVDIVLNNDQITDNGFMDAGGENDEDLVLMQSSHPTFITESVTARRGAGDQVNSLSSVPGKMTFDEGAHASANGRVNEIMDSSPTKDGSAASPRKVTPSISAGRRVIEGQSENFQSEFIRNLIHEALDEFKDQVHKDLQGLHMEMLRQFQIQQAEMRTMLQQYSVNEELVKEVERLREENKKLKKTY